MRGPVLEYARRSLLFCDKFLEVAVVEEPEHLALGRLEARGVGDCVFELIGRLDVLLVHGQVDCGLIHRNSLLLQVLVTHFIAKSNCGGQS